jgi:molecular chaperone HscB
MNYFELYNLPISFNIETGVLKKKYYELSKKYHPDFNIDHQDEVTLSMSAAVNKAYAVFQSKYETIAYVLKLKNLLVDGEKYSLPPDFLMEVMELNEDLSTTSIKAIELLSNEIKEPVSDLLLTGDVNALSENDLLKIKEYYFKEKYLRRLRDRSNGITEFE